RITLQVDLAARDFAAERRLLYRIAIAPCAFDPVALACRLGPLEKQPWSQALEFSDRPPDELRERSATQFEFAPGRELLGQREVIPRLGFLLVGDRGSANLEVA